MIQSNRITSSSSDIIVKNSIFSNFNIQSDTGGGAIYLNKASLKFECYSCTLKSCYSLRYGGAVHVEQCSSSGVFGMCGFNCSSSSAGQLLRVVVSDSSNNNNNHAFVSMSKCASEPFTGSSESFITAKGKYTMHDVNASDCHIASNNIIAPHDTVGNGYIKYIIIAKSSANTATRIVSSTVTVSYYNVINNFISTAIVATSGTPKCENSVFKNNHCTVLVSGVNTVFSNCYFDEQMSGDFTTNNCRIGNIAYSLVKMNIEFIPHCYKNMMCTYYKARTGRIGSFIYYMILVNII